MPEPVSAPLSLSVGALTPLPGKGGQVGQDAEDATAAPSASQPLPPPPHAARRPSSPSRRGSTTRDDAADAPPAEDATLLYNDVKKEKFEVEEKFDFWKLPLSSKLAFVKDNVTVEPMLACYIIPSVLASLAAQNLNLEKACRVNLGYSVEVCDALSARETANYTFEEAEVQRLTAGMAGWKTFIQSSLPATLILFLGSWTDRHGRRKPCMLVPIIGEFLTSIGQIVCTYYYYELPVEAVVFVEAVFPAITGGWFTMFMAIFSYIADITPEETRTLRIGIVNVFFSLSIPVGMALSGMLYKKIGFYGVFATSSVMYLLGFWYGYKYIKEEPRKYQGAGDKPQGIVAFLKDFFDMGYFMDTFRTTFKKGPHGRRTRVVLLMVVVMLVIGPLHGENVVMYLFTRLRFNWDELDFSIFSTFSVGMNLIGTVISVGFFSYVLKFDDGTIGMFSCMSKILAGFVYAFATTTAIIYLAPLVDMVNGTSFIAMRSITSKLVPRDELGKVNALFGACEALMPLVCGPLYSAVYQATINTMPGAFYLMGGAITLPAFFIFAWLRKFSRDEQKLKKEAAKEALKDPA